MVSRMLKLLFATFWTVIFFTLVDQGIAYSNKTQDSFIHVQNLAIETKVKSV